MHVQAWARQNTDIAGEQNDAVLKVHGISLSIRHPSSVQHLKHEIEYVQMRLFDFVKRESPSKACGTAHQSACHLHRSQRIREANQPSDSRCAFPCIHCGQS